MPHFADRERSISVTGQSPFGDSPRTKSERENSLTQLTSDYEVLEVSAKTDVNDVKVPSVPTTAELDEENDNLEILLRVRCFDFPLQVHGLIPERNEESDESPEDVERGVERSEQRIQKRAVGFDQNDDENGSHYVSDLEDNGLKSLPKIHFSSTVLEGQRMDLKEKEGLNNQRKQVPCQPNFKGNGLTCRTDCSLQDSKARKNSLPKLVSFKPAKQDSRRIIRLSKVDKNDITPKNIIDVKVCSVFKVNDVKASLIYSGYKDSWVPHRDRNFMKNSVFFKALGQKPIGLLKRKSSTLAEDSIAAAIQAVQEINAFSPSVDSEVTRKEKEFVVRLPPIC